MPPSVTGGLLGLLFAAGGWLLVRFAPPWRRPRLADRVAPYVDAPPARPGAASRLLAAVRARRAR